MGLIKVRRVIFLTFLVTFQSCISTSKVTTIKSYTLPQSNSPATKNSDSSAFSSDSHTSQYHISNRTSQPDSIEERKDEHSGNVIFNDNFPFGSTGSGGGGNKRKKSLDELQEVNFIKNQNSLAGGLLQNHRVTGDLIHNSADITSAAAAAIVSDFYRKRNNFKFPNEKDDNIQHQSVHQANVAGIVGDGHPSSGGNARALAPFHEGTHKHGWASNSGSCLFSCSGGNIGAGAVSCCQLNYIQCCPNPHQESLNFKNLHHGRGLTGGNFGKIGYAWGPTPYIPPPRPRLCQPYAQPHHPGLGLPLPPPPIVHGAGALLHKGIETIKSNFHNIGQMVKDHVGGSFGWGGNGAAGYYFHRRSDDQHFAQDIQPTANQGPGKSRLVRNRRSIAAKGLDFVQPCPVSYSLPPPNGGWGWIPRPPSVGLGSLIGWSRPTPVNYYNHVQAGIIGGSVGAGYHGLYHHHQPGIYSGATRYGWGWGGGLGYGRGISHCKWDYDCPGSQKCCKGACQFTPLI